MGPQIISVEPWSRYPWLRSGFSARQGGASQSYGADELNLGWTPEDPPVVVAANRNALVRAISGTGTLDLVTMRQVHGKAVRVVERGQPLATPEGKAVLECDGIITRERGLLLAVQTADCVPVLVGDTRTHAVGAFHAGWRGTVARIVEAGVAAMAEQFGSRPEDLTAAIGPAIRMCCFAVGEDVRQRFSQEFLYADDLFVEADAKLYLDLHTANQRQLIGAGLRAEAITTVALCSACARTAEGRRRFFSHRAEKGITGRMMSVIGAVDEPAGG